MFQKLLSEKQKNMLFALVITWKIPIPINKVDRTCGYNKLSGSSQFTATMESGILITSHCNCKLGSMWPNSMLHIFTITVKINCCGHKVNLMIIKWITLSLCKSILLNGCGVSGVFFARNWHASWLSNVEMLIITLRTGGK